MQLLSKNFANMGSLPKELTCDGQGLFPNLEWGESPMGTKSFVLTCDDPDASSGDFVHLIFINIPADTTKIDDIYNTIGDFLPNSAGTKNYCPPCPPSGAHQYIYTLYALDVERIDPKSIEDIKTTIKPHTVESARITGIYGKE